MEALGLNGLWIDFECASGDEIKSAATWCGKALHVVKSGQHPEVKGRDDFAHVEDDRPGVFIDEQVRYRPEAKGLEQLAPSRRRVVYPIGNRVLLWGVADLVGAAGEHGTAAGF